MHRLIMLSNTYQMASLFTNSDNLKIDPENLYLWRMNRRRLEGEAIWDSIHATAGDLNPKMGGRPIMPTLSQSEMSSLYTRTTWVPPADPREEHRRGIYILVRGNFSFPLFDKFDMPDNSASCPRRDVTTVALQPLWTLNNSISFSEAQQFAVRVLKEAGDDHSAWLSTATRIALSRPPTSEEARDALALVDTRLKKEVEKKEAANGLEKQEAEAGATKQEAVLPEQLARIGNARARALTNLCLTIFNLNEFIYID
jgi:hypothetical protein